MNNFRKENAAKTQGEHIFVLHLWSVRSVPNLLLSFEAQDNVPSFVAGSSTH